MIYLKMPDLTNIKNDIDQLIAAKLDTLAAQVKYFGFIILVYRY